MSTTKKMILDRVNRLTPESVVPERAIRLIEKVMEDNAIEAAKKKTHWERVEFFKERLMEIVAPQFRGLLAVAYHEYQACLMRGEDATFESDSDFFDRPYNPYAEGIAQRDAYVACCASLD